MFSKKASNLYSIMHKLTFFAVLLDKNYHENVFTCLQHCLVLVVQTYIYLAVSKIGNSNYQINLICTSVFPFKKKTVLMF